jgi:alginate O-acetyltransferase complex protein AlgI
MPIRNIIGIPLTFYWFCAFAIFFRSNSLSSAIEVEKAFVFLNSSGSENINVQIGWIFWPLTLVHWAAYNGWFTGWERKIPSWSLAVFYGGSPTTKK